MDIQHLSLKEWEKVEEKALTAYKGKLGNRPRFGDVQKLVSNRYVITSLEYIASLVLVVLFIFTSFKVGALAVRYSDDLLHSILDVKRADGAVVIANIDPRVTAAFALTSIIMFILISTPGMIYFKLLDHDPENVKAKQTTALQFDYSGVWQFLYSLGRNVIYMFSLDWITPRLPMLITWAVIAWLVYVSDHGSGSIWEKYLPVAFEVGLAALVGRLLDKRAAYRQVVFDRLDEETGKYDSRVNEYGRDPLYLQTLFNTVRDALITLRRNSEQPNIELEAADTSVINQAVLAEYKRFSGGQQFADMVRAMKMEQVAKETMTEEKRRPRDGKLWTPATLFADIQARGVTGEYTERNVVNDYDAQFEARKAWRGDKDKKNGAAHMYERSRSAA